MICRFSIKNLFVYVFLLLNGFSCNKKALNTLNTQDILFENVVNVKDFGAFPNDGKDDSDAIQNAIDFAIESNKSSRVFCPPGVYILDKGLVVARVRQNGEYDFVTLTIGGEIATYSSDQNIGKVVVFKMKRPTFGIALQLARNCVVENIVFEGSALYSTEIKNIVDWNIEDWGQKSNAETNRYSPSCAIVIDPFHKNVPNKDQYKDHFNKYSNKSSGGSSMILIKGCSFFHHYIAIANNPSSNNQNGENIRAENCHASTCHTFWSSGQTQSRGNSIENVYALFLHTFVSGTEIGNQMGTPPTIQNANVAGFCKQIISMNTGFSGFAVSQSYFESLWSIGFCNANFVSFIQAQLKFHLPNKQMSTPLKHLESNAVVTFQDCDISYFSNCKYKIPFMFESANLNLIGGQVEGGLILPGFLSNAGGERVHRIHYKNVKMKCYNSVISQEYSGIIPSNMANNYVIGGARVRTNRNEEYITPGSTYQLERTESKVVILMQNYQIYFETKNPAQYQIGDNLITETSIEVEQGKNFRPTLGYITRIDGTKVILEGCPYEVINKEVTVNKIGFHRFRPD